VSSVVHPALVHEQPFFCNDKMFNVILIFKKKNLCKNPSFRNGAVIFHSSEETHFPLQSMEARNSVYLKCRLHIYLLRAIR